ncbi:ZIP family metal transporter [uncultured Marinococcus sp.]|uniref:ZIP family metal transporter n=1 Tax=uncultured Marinococcus sp. TaxID=487012 RepID=UPI0026301376|nr:ZIP family metal transporter [uncultured Marinococcus sp.]
MMNWFMELSPMWQAFIGTLFTWFMTAAGASLVWFTNKASTRFMDSMLAFAAGVMIAASFWSLLAPSIEMAEEQGMVPFLPPVIGFLLGGVFLLLLDYLIPMLNPDRYFPEIKDPRSKHRTFMLVSSITLHNIPEGLAIGVAFGALANNFSEAGLAGAIALAIGIGIQNFPEGTAVSLPLQREGMSRRKSFFYGQFSGFVEPVAALLGAWAVVVIEPLVPYALSFAAGAMIFVVAKEAIPGSQERGHIRLTTCALMIGFSIMMVLDVSLG